MHLSFYGLDVECDPVSQISRAYTGEFAMPDGRLSEVVIDFLSEPDLDELAVSIEAGE